MRAASSALAASASSACSPRVRARRARGRPRGAAAQRRVEQSQRAPPRPAAGRARARRAGAGPAPRRAGRWARPTDRRAGGRAAGARSSSVGRDLEPQRAVAPRVAQAAAVALVRLVEDDEVRRGEHRPRALLGDQHVRAREDDVRPRADVRVHLLPQPLAGRAGELAERQLLRRQQHARGHERSLGRCQDAAHGISPAGSLGPAGVGPRARDDDVRRPRPVRARRHDGPRRRDAAGRPCLDAGINFVDTADVYSAGLSEEILGEALQGRRDRVVLATKARMPMGDGPNDAGLSRHHLIASCEASLRRLGVDHIDLYQVHEWDGVTPRRGDAARARHARRGPARCATSAARTTPAGR